MPVPEMARLLSEGVRRLHEAALVLVGTCPDLGTIKRSPPKQIARIWSRKLGAAQTIAVIEQGRRTVLSG